VNGAVEERSFSSSMIPGGPLGGHTTSSPHRWSPSRGRHRRRVRTATAWKAPRTAEGSGITDLPDPPLGISTRPFPCSQWVWLRLAPDSSTAGPEESGHWAWKQLLRRCITLRGAPHAVSVLPPVGRHRHRPRSRWAADRW